MKTILIGFSDERGIGECSIVAAPDVPQAKQIEIFQNAKRNHVFPKGVKRIVSCRVEVCEIAVSLGDDVSKNIAEKNAKIAATQKANSEKLSQETADKKALVDAEAAVQKASQARNVLLAKENSLKAKLRNAGIALDSTGQKAVADELKKLSPEVKAAVETYEAAAKVLAELKSPKKPETKKEKKQ